MCYNSVNINKFNRRNLVIYFAPMVLFCYTFFSGGIFSQKKKIYGTFDMIYNVPHQSTAALKSKSDKS